MNRRSFFKRLAQITATMAAAPVLLPILKPVLPAPVVEYVDYEEITIPVFVYMTWPDGKTTKRIDTWTGLRAVKSGFLESVELRVTSSKG